jgi:hypothetical protein
VTQVATALSTIAAGDTLEVVMAGSTLTVLKNGVQLWSGTDAFNASATKCGMQSNGAAFRSSAFYWRP